LGILLLAEASGGRVKAVSNLRGSCGEPGAEYADNIATWPGPSLDPSMLTLLLVIIYIGLPVAMIVVFIAAMISLWRGK
jgi:hypothetical protein